MLKAHVLDQTTDDAVHCVLGSRGNAELRSRQQLSAFATTVSLPLHFGAIVEVNGFSEAGPVALSKTRPR